MFSFLKYAVLAAFMASSATAATIYDESVSGDAGVGLGAVDLGVLGVGVNTILFDNLGADQNGLDQDGFTFTILQEATLDIDTSQGPVVAFLDDGNTSIFGGCCGFTTNVTEPDPLAPATYTLRFETDTSFGQGLTFSSNINVADASAVVPLPATALLLLSSLVGLGVFRARKSA